jgi:hypothetical protein
MPSNYVRKVAVASLPIKKKIAVPCTSKEKLQFVCDWCFLWPLFPTGLLILVVSSRRKRTHNYGQYIENIIYFPNKDYKNSVPLEMFEEEVCHVFWNSKTVLHGTLSFVGE